MSQDSFEKGLQKRRKVMGNAFVDRALSQGGLRSELRTDEAGKVFLWITY